MPSAIMGTAHVVEAPTYTATMNELPAHLRDRHARPSMRAFLRSRVISANGIAAALYLLLALWIARHPDRARGVWRRLQSNDYPRRQS